MKPANGYSRAPWERNSESISTKRAFLAERVERWRVRIDERHAQATRAACAIRRGNRGAGESAPYLPVGSRLDREKSSEISDLDIVVEGVKGPAELFRVLGIAMTATSLPVGVVDLEKVPAEVAERIRTHGTLVHVRRDPWPHRPDPGASPATRGGLRANRVRARPRDRAPRTSADVGAHRRGRRLRPSGPLAPPRLD